MWKTSSTGTLTATQHMILTIGPRHKRIAKSPKKLDYCDGPDPDDQRKTLKVKKKIPVFETYFQQFVQWMQI